MRTRNWIAAVLAWLCVAGTALAAAPPSQRELNGFFLGQHVSVLEHVFGKPAELMHRGDFSYAAYELPGQDEAYMVFSTHKQRPYNNVGIQIAGKAAPDMRPFLGLRLGADREAVRRVLGPPSRTTKLGDFDGMQNSVQWEYEARNYNVVLNGDGRLVSIKISGYAGFPEDPTNQRTFMEQFTAAILSGKTDALVEVLMPDLEIYRASDPITITRGLRTELDDLASPIRRALLEGAHSVRAMLTEEKPPGKLELRVWEHGPGLGTVVKYPTSQIVQEIVFIRDAGKLRAWEIRLRP